KNKKSLIKKMNRIIKSILMPCYYQNDRKKTTFKSNSNSSSTTVAVSMHDKEKPCCYDSNSSPSTRDSMTIADGPQQPWIVPSEYHKSISVSSATSSNQWIFRTGWTPQPDPLAFLDKGWCANCNACVQKKKKYCSCCGANPLIISEYQPHMLNINEIVK
ncbi:hypothetical protein BD408DRAFT_418881, partial [Parasitella parasitica]